MMRQLKWLDEENCTEPAILEFPVFPLNGVWSILVPSLIIIYCVILLAKVCDSRFIPCIKIICYRLGLSSDVAGATLMAAGVSSPDLFVNLVGTFLTEGDIGVGTVVGCGVINTLAVPALCILLSSKSTIKLNYWALSRDCLIYFIAMTALFFSLVDGKVSWYEALIMVVFYFLYIIVMIFNRNLRRRFEICWKKIRRKRLEPSASLPLIMKPIMSAPYGLDADAEHHSGWRSLVFWPENCNCFEKFYWIISWPINVAMFLTIPSSRSSLDPWSNAFTFFICLGWIASVSYIVAWMITLIGFNLAVPDSLMGITFLAIGMSVPESFTSIIVAKQGHGSMAISNTLGSNIFDILICLGLPWLIKSAFFSPAGYVLINSRGIGLNTGLLLITLIILYLLLAVNKFQLKSSVGMICLCLYSIYCVLASLMELNVFFLGNLPICPLDLESL